MRVQCFFFTVLRRFGVWKSSPKDVPNSVVSVPEFSAKMLQLCPNFTRKNLFENSHCVLFNSVQTRCNVKGEAQKSPLFWRFSGGFSGKKQAYTAPLQCRTFLCRKKWGPQRKDFGGRYGFPGFRRVFVSTTGLESFSLRPEKFPKRFSFSGGSVRFFLPCFWFSQDRLFSRNSTTKPLN